MCSLFCYWKQANSDNEALISDTESVGENEEQKIEEQVKAINLNSSAAAGSSTEFSEEEDNKADEFKTAGNESFKGKSDWCKTKPQLPHLFVTL